MIKNFYDLIFIGGFDRNDVGDWVLAVCWALIAILVPIFALSMIMIFTTAS